MLDLSTNLLETTHDWTVTISNHFSIAAAIYWLQICLRPYFSLQTVI